MLLMVHVQYGRLHALLLWVQCGRMENRRFHQADEDKTISDERMRTYINTAMHQECRAIPNLKRAPTSNAIDTFKAMLAKRTKEEE